MPRVLCPQTGQEEPQSMDWAANDQAVTTSEASHRMEIWHVGMIKLLPLTPRGLPYAEFGEWGGDVYLALVRLACQSCPQFQDEAD